MHADYRAVFGPHAGRVRNLEALAAELDQLHARVAAARRHAGTLDEARQAGALAVQAGDTRAEALRRIADLASA